MLGNVIPYKPNLSEEDYSLYKSTYCGLCKTLGKEYGTLSRFALNYDMVFIALIYDEINGVDKNYCRQACFANPIKKKTVRCSDAALVYACDCLVLLTYFKLFDNIKDETFLKKTGNLLILPFVYFKYKKAAKRQAELFEVFKKETAIQNALEKEVCNDIDKISMPTANMTRAIIHTCGGNADAQAFGFYLGRVIYLIDALKDKEADSKDGRYNIFENLNYEANICKEECFMSLGEMAYNYKKLEIKSNIIDNIIYLGLTRAIEFYDSEDKK